MAKYTSGVDQKKYYKCTKCGYKVYYSDGEEAKAKKKVEKCYDSHGSLASPYNVKTQRFSAYTRYPISVTLVFNYTDEKGDHQAEVVYDINSSKITLIGEDD